MQEDAAAILERPIEPNVRGLITNFITQLIGKIFRPREAPTHPLPRQRELGKAHKTIRMAENNGDSYDAIAKRIRAESARYKAFKENPEPIGKITLRIKKLDSDETPDQEQYEVRDPAEGKASVTYEQESSETTVLEFVLHDRNFEPLFPIVRTYANWVGSQEFDLGKDNAFYLNMVETDKPGYVSVQAGFKAREAEIPAFTLREATPVARQVPDKPVRLWPFRKMVLTNLVVIALCCLAFKVFGTNWTRGENVDAGQIVAKTVVPRIANIVVTPLSATSASELAGPRKESVTARAKQLTHIGTFVVTVEGNEVQFVVTYDPHERGDDNLFPALSVDNKSLLNVEYGFARPEFVGGTDKLAKILYQIIAGTPKAGSNEKENEATMTE